MGGGGRSLNQLNYDIAVIMNTTNIDSETISLNVLKSDNGFEKTEVLSKIPQRVSDEPRQWSPRRHGAGGLCGGLRGVVVMVVVVEGRVRGGRRRDGRAEVVLQHGRGGGLVVEDGHPDQPLGSLSHVRRLQLGSQLSLPLVPPVLEPDLDLGLGEV